MAAKAAAKLFFHVKISHIKFQFIIDIFHENTRILNLTYSLALPIFDAKKFLAVSFLNFLETVLMCVYPSENTRGNKKGLIGA